ncbi:MULTISPECIES: ergothioneine biosynthesis protein EgtB [Nitrospirillum]|uniref:Ergothioneine biosynthesis protein EgtB n=1 Tax=Nitrospirillum amazonense TaxID=28077 RepID=A0A560F5G1_9PROT|nr:ergothioneine biosynthesis protein EgtB [Nitrospirillum amazonense]MEC4589875.1 ergothioneine biosynthesis protein EgtB [Nitrospirillum amazonense]TWB16839.1 ergothioneine biosynthesis protein EgtB [Nitrospirillum amazonense]
MPFAVPVPAHPVPPHPVPADAASPVQSPLSLPGRHRPADAQARYRAVRQETLARTRGLTAEDQTLQSMPDASPTKWHLAHTTWFFETFLLTALVPGYQPFDPSFRYLFNSYYEGVGERWPRPARGLLSRPTVAQVLDYRAHVDGAMDAWLAGGVDARAAALLELGLQHEQQHQELIITDIKHALLLHPFPAGVFPPPATPALTAGDVVWRGVPAGLYAIGATGQEDFIFDNEGPRHKVWLEAFEIADRVVTNAEYLDFMADGGYRRPDLWLSDGWATVQAQGWQAPLYWQRGDEGEWQVKTLSGVRAIDPNEPVCHVSQYEADAYAKWAEARWPGARLPTEAEWEIAAGEPGQRPGDDGSFHAHTATGFYGDVWEWTASAYTGYPGYRPPDGAIGEYNGKFMSGQMVLRGGSRATPAGHVRKTYRNFFPPAARWQFSGIRLARTTP